jgi:hypothetical protein
VQNLIDKAFLAFLIVAAVLLLFLTVGFLIPGAIIFWREAFQ